ncbi:MAG: hypothetical protein J1E99_00385 [Muribaculaceae bacterium]|nr:hypothetical protein [Muribaculaceae bacterium]
MPYYKILLTLLFLVLSRFSSFAQDIVEIFQETVGFAQLLTWGEQNQNVGLKFSWKHEENGWSPVGNGFEFISKGLGLYKYEEFDEDEIIEYPGHWFVKEELRDYDIDLDPALFASQNLIRWVHDDNTKNKKANVHIKLIGDSLISNSILIPSKIKFEGDTVGLNDDFEFLAMNDSINGTLVFRILNLKPYEIYIDIDNQPHPASYVGWRTLMTAKPGVPEVESNVSAIRMNGNLQLDPYSLTILTFPTKQQKNKIPKFD